MELHLGPNVSMFGLPVCGSDRLVKDEGAMSWKVFGLFTIAAAAGPDVTRSDRGRGAAEMIAWLPLARTGPAESAAQIERGRLKSLKFPRWRNPGEGRLR